MPANAYLLNACCGSAAMPGRQSIWDQLRPSARPCPVAPEPGACFHKQRAGPGVPPRLAAPMALQAALLAPAPSARARAEAAAALAHAPLQRALLRDPRALYPRLSALAPAPAPAGVYPPLYVPPEFQSCPLPTHKIAGAARLAVTPIRRLCSACRCAMAVAVRGDTMHPLHYGGTCRTEHQAGGQ
jgi:hypothetical protein